MLALSCYGFDEVLSSLDGLPEGKAVIERFKRDQ